MEKMLREYNPIDFLADEPSQSAPYSRIESTGLDRGSRSLSFDNHHPSQNQTDYVATGSILFLKAEKKRQAATLSVSAEVIRQSVSSCLYETRRLSGLTWQELADTFGVARRSVHLWVNGGNITPNNENTVREFLQTIRHIYSGTARATRDFLMTVGADGLSPFDMLKDGRYEAVRGLVPVAFFHAPRHHLSSEELEKRLGPDLQTQLSAIDEPVPTNPVNARIRKTWKVMEKTPKE